MTRKIIWAPWRIEYIEKAKESLGTDKKDECFLCTAWYNDDELVVYKAQNSFIIMNRYPYNPGHVMVCPKTHTRYLENIPEEEKIEMWKLLEVSIKALTSAIKPHGFNVGINIGRIAGAGLEDHLHIHVVPRWAGDTNFMPICGNSKIVVEDLKSSIIKIKSYLQEIVKELKI